MHSARSEAIFGLGRAGECQQTLGRGPVPGTTVQPRVYMELASRTRFSRRLYVASDQYPLFVGRRREPPAKTDSNDRKRDGQRDILLLPRPQSRGSLEEVCPDRKPGTTTRPRVKLIYPRIPRSPP